MSASDEVRRRAVWQIIQVLQKGTREERWVILDGLRTQLRQRLSELDFGALTSDEATVLVRHLGLIGDADPAPLATIARDLGISRDEALRLEFRALCKLQRRWQAQEHPDEHVQ